MYYWALRLTVACLFCVIAEWREIYVTSILTNSGFHARISAIWSLFQIVVHSTIPKIHQSLVQSPNGDRMEIL